MKLSIEQRTDLALRALRLLETSNSYLRAREMAADLRTTPHYLPQVLGPLVSAGWLTSAPGPTGGYRIDTDLTSRSMLELIELMEGPVDSGRCVLRGGPCGHSEFCALHMPWQEARDALTDRLGQLPLSTRNKEKRNV